MLAARYRLLKYHNRFSIKTNKHVICRRGAKVLGVKVFERRSGSPAACATFCICVIFIFTCNYAIIAVPSFSVYTGLILSSTLDVIGYIGRSLAQRYRANSITAKVTDRLANAWNNFVASIAPMATARA